MTPPAADETRRARVRLAALYTVAVFAACSIPGHSIPLSILWSWDKLWHLLAFTAFAFLWRRAGAGMVAALVGGFAFGAAIEVWQQFAPIDRFFDELDLVANAAGLLVGLTAWSVWDRLRPNQTGAATPGR